MTDRKHALIVFEEMAGLDAEARACVIHVSPDATTPASPRTGSALPRPRRHRRRADHALERRANTAARRRVALFPQVLEAVPYAHATLVVHRALKPGSIPVDAAGQTDPRSAIRSTHDPSGRTIARHHPQILAVERGELAFEFRVRTGLPGP